TRDRLVHHDERGEPPRRPGLLDSTELLDAGELLVERADPAEAGRDRVGLGRDVVAVERIADLEAEGVARAEAARLRAALQHGVPEPHRVVGLHEQLDSPLTGVAGPIDHALDAVEI